jgi:hypothetical protein
MNLLSLIHNYSVIAMKYKKWLMLASVTLLFSLLAISPPSTLSLPDVEMVDAVVILKENIELDMPEIEIDHVYDAINGFSGIMPLQIYQQLSQADYVKAIQINREISILEDDLDWGVDDTQADQVWGGAENAVDVVSGNYAGQGVKVAIIDTGIDYTHSDLNDNYVGGYDFVDDDSDPMDEHNHGTHCAGIVAAEDNEAGVIGVAPHASLYGVRVLNAQGSGTIADIVAGIDWTVDNGMDVISMSLGASSGDSSLEAACDNANAAGVVVVCASGNDYGSSISYPAHYDSTIAVGAIDSSHNIASFSNVGPEQCVVAPGVNIYSTVRGGSYQQMSGTSMACPMVSGVSALMLSADSTLTTSELKTIMYDTAVDLGSSGFDNTYGYGMVDAKAAVDEIDGGGGDDTTPPTVDITNPSDGATVSDTVSIQADASDNIGVTKVSCRIDSGSWNDDSSSPYSWSWDTTSYSDGSHTITCRAYDAAGNYDDDSITVTVDNDGGGGGEPQEYTFTGSVSQGSDSDIHTFSVPTDTLTVDVELSFSSSYDFDLSLWDNLGQRTGGWTSTESSTSNEIANGDYSGYSANPETITVDPPEDFGTWEVGCYAYDGSGSYTITVIVTPSSGGGDTTPPIVDITSPSDGATVSDTITIQADASDETAMDSVEFYIDGSLLSTDSSSPYSASLDTTTLSDGSHTITAKAIDTSGNSAEDSISINVDNGGAPPADTMYVYSIEMSYEEVTWWWWVIGYDVFITVTVYDGAGNPLEGVTVSIDLDLPGGSTASGTADTGSDGSVTFTYEEGDSGTYVATVTNLEKSGYTYDSDSNVETSESIYVS